MSDLISRQAVLNELEKWDWQDLYLPIHFKQILDDVPSVENKGDLISRAEVLKHKEILRDDNRTGHQAVKTKYIRELPSVENKGEWKFYDEEFYQQGRFASVNHRIRECSICHHKIADFAGNMNFCPNCGADMRGET